MNLLHVFLLSVAAFLVFKLLAPMILGFLVNTFGAVVNMTVLNAVTFGAVFLAVHQLNQNMKVLDV